MTVPFPLEAVAAFPLLLIGMIALIFATQRHSARKMLIVVPLVIYLASLLLPALYPTGKEFYPGYYVLLFGWLGLVGAVVAWYANPFFLVSILAVLSDSRKVALSCALAAALLALDTFRVLEIGLPNNGSNIKLDGLGIGAWLWLLAIALLIPIALATPKSSKPTERQAKQENPTKPD